LHTLIGASSSRASSRFWKLTLEELRQIEDHLDQLDQRMTDPLTARQDAVQRLAEVPGLGVDSAQQIMAALSQAVWIGVLMAARTASERQLILFAALAVASTVFGGVFLLTLSGIT
jgi:hypothetical protein